MHNKKIKLYAGYYELYLTTDDLPTPYMYQGEFESVDDVLEWLHTTNDFGPDEVPEKFDHLPNADVSVYADESLGLSDSVSGEFIFSKGEIKITKEY